MRKIQTTLAVAVVAAFAFSVAFTSCKKKDDNPVGNYTCTCILTLPGATTDTVVLPENNVAKNTATSACNTAQTTYTSASTGITAKCTLK